MRALAEGAAPQPGGQDRKPRAVDADRLGGGWGHSGGGRGVAGFVTGDVSLRNHTEMPRSDH